MMEKNWGLIGHEWAVEMLQEQIHCNSIRQAYLFCGPSGVGRRTLAIRLIQALNCPNAGKEGEACGECKTCRQIERMQYADLDVIQAEKEGGILKVEAIREVRKRLALTPYLGKYRVALFLRFQEANTSAANALLKTLEEAPPADILLLTADTPEQLLPTIVSRCEILRLRPVAVETLEQALIMHGADEEKARLLAHVSGGRPGFALRMLQDAEAQDFRLKRLNDLQDLLKSNRRERFAYAEKLTNRKYEARERFRDTLLVWLSFWRDVLLLASGEKATIANIDRKEEIAALADRLALEGARKLVEDGQAAIDRLERNVNPRLLAEVLLLDWPKVVTNSFVRKL
jgi:DNA polymerase-3 subunit delta'